MAARYNRFATLPVVADTDYDGMVSRLEHIFLSGTPELVSTGSQWYADRHRELQGIAALVGLPVDIVAYVCSALSPQTNWAYNFAALLQTLDAWTHGQAAPRTATLYKANDVKAWAMLVAWEENGDRAEIRAILGKGDKTHAFARNLVEDNTLADGTVAVTIDTISYQAATGTVPANGIRGGRYQRVARAFAYLARKYGLPLYVFQAIVWTVYRGTGV